MTQLAGCPDGCGALSDGTMPPQCSERYAFTHHPPTRTHAHVHHNSIIYARPVARGHAAPQPRNPRDPCSRPAVRVSRPVAGRFGSSCMSWRVAIPYNYLNAPPHLVTPVIMP